MAKMIIQFISRAGWSHEVCGELALLHLEGAVFNVCMRESLREHRPLPGGQTDSYLHPGSVLTVYPEAGSSERKLNAVLSAVIYDGNQRKFGLTVGHVFSTVNDACFVTNSEQSESCDSLLGSCVLLERETVQFKGKTVTADVALIELSSDCPPVHNVIRLPSSYHGNNGSSCTAAASTERTFERFQMTPPPPGVKVLVQTAYRGWVPGTIDRSSWTVTFGDGVALYNVLRVSFDDVEPHSGRQNPLGNGDSGGLIVGLPAPGQTVVEVYGMLIGLVKAGGRSFAVGTRLCDVLAATRHDQKYDGLFGGFQGSRLALYDHSLEISQSEGAPAEDEKSEACVDEHITSDDSVATSASPTVSTDLQRAICKPSRKVEQSVGDEQISHSLDTSVKRRPAESQDSHEEVTWMLKTSVTGACLMTINELSASNMQAVRLLDRFNTHGCVVQLRCISSRSLVVGIVMEENDARRCPVIDSGQFNVDQSIVVFYLVNSRLATCVNETRGLFVPVMYVRTDCPGERHSIVRALEGEVKSMAENTEASLVPTSLIGSCSEMPYLLEATADGSGQITDAETVLQQQTDIDCRQDLCDEDLNRHQSAIPDTAGTCEGTNSLPSESHHSMNFDILQPRENTVISSAKRLANDPHVEEHGSRLDVFTEEGQAAVKELDDWLSTKSWLSMLYVDHLNDNRVVIEVKREAIREDEARDVIVKSGKLVNGLTYVVTASPDPVCRIVFCADLDQSPYCSSEKNLHSSDITVKPGMTIKVYKPSSAYPSSYVAYEAQFSGTFGLTSKNRRLAVTVGHLFHKFGDHFKNKDDETIGRCLLKIDEIDLAILELNSDERIKIDNSVSITVGNPPQRTEYRLRVGRLTTPMANVLVLRKCGTWYRGVITQSNVRISVLDGRESRMLYNMMMVQRQSEDGRWVEVGGPGDSGGLVVQDPFDDGHRAWMLEPELLVYGIVSARSEQGEITVCNNLYDALREAEEEFSTGYEPATGVLEFCDTHLRGGSSSISQRASSRRERAISAASKTVTRDRYRQFSRKMKKGVRKTLVRSGARSKLVHSPRRS